MSEWLCLVSTRLSFTKGKVYKTGEYDRLIDDDGDSRLPPDFYSGCFKEIKLDLENV